MEGRLGALGDPTRRAIFERSRSARVRSVSSPGVAGQSARGLAAPKVLKDAGLVIDRPRAPVASTGSTRRGPRAARLLRPVLEQSLGRLQDGCRATRRGGLMSIKQRTRQFAPRSSSRRRSSARSRSSPMSSAASSRPSTTCSASRSQRRCSSRAWAATCTTAAWTAASAAGRACSPTSRRTGWCSAGTSARMADRDRPREDEQGRGARDARGIRGSAVACLGEVPADTTRI